MADLCSLKPAWVRLIFLSSMNLERRVARCVYFELAAVFFPRSKLLGASKSNSLKTSGDRQRQTFDS